MPDAIVGFGFGVLATSIAWFLIARNNKKKVARVLGVTTAQVRWEIKNRLKKLIRG